MENFIFCVVKCFLKSKKKCCPPTPNVYPNPIYCHPFICFLLPFLCIYFNDVKKDTEIDPQL